MSNDATHTHRTQGGRYALCNEYAGAGPLEGQRLVAYRDLDRDLHSVTTMDDWRQHWRPLAGDDCPICLGDGTDKIKGNKANPCGGCFGLGKVREDGETPEDRWQLGGVAMCIIKRQQRKIAALRKVMDQPEVKAAIEARQQRITDATAEQEQRWRDGKGKGPGKQRYTGD